MRLSYAFDFSFLNLFSPGTIPVKLLFNPSVNKILDLGF